jgi:cellobiose phosphorylase
VQFAEIYHPDTGAIYGGMQETSKGIRLWKSLPRQTWCATGYMRMWLRGVLGMEFRVDGIGLNPWLPQELDFVELKGLRYREAILTVRVEGHGKVRQTTLDDTEQEAPPFIPSNLRGEHELRIILK